MQGQGGHAPRHECPCLETAGQQKAAVRDQCERAHSRRAVQSPLSAREGGVRCAAHAPCNPGPPSCPRTEQQQTPVHTAEQSDEPDGMCMVRVCCWMATCKRRTAEAVSCMGVRHEFACAGAHRRLPQQRRHFLPPLLKRCKPRRSSASTFVWQRPESGDRCHSQFFQTATVNNMSAPRKARGIDGRWSGPTVMCEG